MWNKKKVSDVKTRPHCQERRPAGQVHPSSPTPGPSGVQPRGKGQKKKTKAPENYSEEHVAKLEQGLLECAREIDRLENSELDFDDDKDSVYIRGTYFSQN